MVGIQGIGGVSEPKPEGPGSLRDRNKTASEASAKSEDGVVISNEAQAAATLALIVQTAKTQPDLRADRVDAARAAIERGDYKKPEVVAEVAKRIEKHL